LRPRTRFPPQLPLSAEIVFFFLEHKFPPPAYLAPPLTRPRTSASVACHPKIPRGPSQSSGCGITFFKQVFLHNGTFFFLLVGINQIPPDYTSPLFIFPPGSNIFDLPIPQRPSPPLFKNETPAQSVVSRLPPLFPQIALFLLLGEGERQARFFPKRSPLPVCCRACPPAITGPLSSPRRKPMLPFRVRHVSRKSLQMSPFPGLRRYRPFH